MPKLVVYLDLEFESYRDLTNCLSSLRDFLDVEKDETKVLKDYVLGFNSFLEEKSPWSK